MLGKKKCKILKEIRRRVAEENDIPYVTSQCNFQGACKGTCPKCEQELRDLEQQLERRQRLGKVVSVSALTASLLVSATGCPANEPARKTVSEQNTTLQTEASTEMTETADMLKGELTVGDPVPDDIDQSIIVDPEWSDEDFGQVVAVLGVLTAQSPEETDALTGDFAIVEETTESNG